MLRSSLALLIVLSLGLPASSLTFREQTFTCPVDGKTFRANLPASGTSFGIMLDFKKIGPIASPWQMPVCPGNGFVLHKQDYSATEIETIKAMVDSPEFAALRARGNQWLTAAFEMRRLGAKPDAIAGMYLSATWAAGADYTRVAEEAYDYMSGMPDVDKGVFYLALGELERRLGRFEAARERFTKLPPGYAEAMAARNWKPADLDRYIKRQLHFIAAKDGFPQPLDADSQ